MSSLRYKVVQIWPGLFTFVYKCKQSRSYLNHLVYHRSTGKLSTQFLIWEKGIKKIFQRLLVCREMRQKLSNYWNSPQFVKCSRNQAEVLKMWEVVPDEKARKAAHFFGRRYHPDYNFTWSLSCLKTAKEPTNQWTNLLHEAQSFLRS